MIKFTFRERLLGLFSKKLRQRYYLNRTFQLPDNHWLERANNVLIRSIERGYDQIKYRMAVGELHHIIVKPEGDEHIYTQNEKLCIIQFFRNDELMEDGKLPRLIGRNEAFYFKFLAGLIISGPARQERGHFNHLAIALGYSIRVSCEVVAEPCDGGWKLDLRITDSKIISKPSPRVCSQPLG